MSWHTKICKLAICDEVYTIIIYFSEQSDWCINKHADTLYGEDPVALVNVFRLCI